MNEVMIVPILTAWFVNQADKKPNYLREADRKFSVSPLFGHPRQTLLRQTQKPRS
jgi:hypothetical protein